MPESPLSPPRLCFALPRHAAWQLPCCPDYRKSAAFKITNFQLCSGCDFSSKDKKSKTVKLFECLQNYVAFFGCCEQSTQQTLRQIELREESSTFELRLSSRGCQRRTSEFSPLLPETRRSQFPRGCRASFQMHYWMKARNNISDVIQSQGLAREKSISPRQEAAGRSFVNAGAD